MNSSLIIITISVVQVAGEHLMTWKDVVFTARIHFVTSSRRCFSRIEKKSFLSILIYICEVFFDNQRKKRQIRWNGNITSSQKVKRTKRKKHSTTSNVCEWREFYGPIIKRSKAKQTNLFQYFYFKIKINALISSSRNISQLPEDVHLPGAFSISTTSLLTC